MSDLWDKHKRTVERNFHTLEGKEALLQMWEELPDTDPDYVRELRKKVYALRARVLTLKPTSDEISAGNKLVK